MVLTEEASGAAHVVFFEKSQCTHISYITHMGPKCAGGGGDGGSRECRLRPVSAIQSPQKSTFLMSNSVRWPDTVSLSS